MVSSDNVSPFLLNAKSAGRRKTRSKVTALRMSDTKKIKTKLVTFVTDNVLLFTYFGNKISCAHDASKNDKTASREETKKVAMRQQ